MKIKIVAEIGCNHKGDIYNAYDMIHALADCGVDIIKFQKREPRLLLTPEQYAAPHPNPIHAYGPSYGDHREALEFTIQQHEKLKWCVESRGCEYSCSVWDHHSAWEIRQLDPQHIKIPSATNLDWRIYEQLGDFTGTLHVSTGMTTNIELNEVNRRTVSFENLVIYHCTSGYPIQNKDVYLNDIKKLSALTKGEVGYSGHHLGTDVDLVAIGLGARWIERHFTLNKNWKGTDHAASLNTPEMVELVRKIRSIQPTLQDKLELPPVEVEQREKLKRLA